jgi:hypothetical protein
MVSPRTCKLVMGLWFSGLSPRRTNRDSWVLAQARFSHRRTWFSVVSGSATIQ